MSRRGEENLKVDPAKVRQAMKLEKRYEWVRTLSAVALGGATGCLAIQMVPWMIGLRLQAVFWLALALMGLTIAGITHFRVRRVEKEIARLLEEAKIGRDSD